MNAAVERVEVLQSPERRFRVTPAVEIGVIILAIGIAAVSYFMVRTGDDRLSLISPWLAAAVLVANLLPWAALLVLAGRRIAKRRAEQSPLAGGGRLHVRLVAIFSMLAAIPILLVTVFASLLFQYGVAFWSSDKARGMLENATVLVQENYRTELERVRGEALAMSGDVASYLRTTPIDSPKFIEGLAYQLYLRNLSEALIVKRGRDGVFRTLALLNPYDRQLNDAVKPAMADRIDKGAKAVILEGQGRAASLVPLNYDGGSYLYVARVFDDRLATQLRRGEAITADYHALQVRSRTLQLRFNLALFAISLFIVGLAVWIALAVADRLVRPVAELVGAARRVESGDLTARVAETQTRDEVGTLANAFNRMTERLESQNTALVTANAQLENRRALIEAVMSGVSAGVVSIAEDRTIRLINSSAETLLGTGDASSVGRPLRDVAPELDALLDQPARDAVVQMTVGSETRTLAVRIARDGTGPILTFDDITQQLNDQRRAAWSDVARRIAHEIKNPLTPIQLAAERLQRRYGKTVDPADTTFARLTDTIVRQVGDLRRMVDEFSSFARMPKPSFQQEPLVDIARQTLFLHEVAHPAIAFTLVHDDPGPILVCDRRQIGQALTNIVKNAVEAIEATGEAGGSVTMALAEAPGTITITVADSGVGLPVERDRIVEPYMTTRARGTGLGLAIVKKIVEEHCGTIAFADRAEGGTLVTMRFDTQMLAAIDTRGDDGDTSDGGQLAALTRNRT